MIIICFFQLKSWGEGNIWNTEETRNALFALWTKGDSLTLKTLLRHNEDFGMSSNMLREVVLAMLHRIACLELYFTQCCRNLKALSLIKIIFTTALRHNMYQISIIRVSINSSCNLFMPCNKTTSSRKNVHSVIPPYWLTSNVASSSFRFIHIMQFMPLRANLRAILRRVSRS